MECVANLYSNLEQPSLLAGELLVLMVHRVVTEDEPDLVADCEINGPAVVVGLCLGRADSSVV